MTNNVRRALVSVQSLRNRGQGLEGMGLWYGVPGEGKTTTLAYVAGQLNGIYVRANACWSVTAMLAEICRELGLPRKGRKAMMITDIVEHLIRNPADDGTTRPIFIDEADYLLRQTEMLDALRDIYDMVPGSSVILVGMEDMAIKLMAQSNGRFARRITQWVEFTGIDLDDTRVLAETVCDTAITDDLLRHLHNSAQGNIGRMVIGLSRIDSFGKSSGGGEVSLKTWGERPLYYDQPTFRRRR